MAAFVRCSLLKSTNTSQGTKISLCSFIQKRNIMGKALRESISRPPQKPHFDYVHKDYTWIRSLLDRTTHRFDENSKLVVVDGPIAVGKTKFATALAEDLGMKHYPEVNMDMFYIRPNGIDLRIFDSKIPEDTRTFDHVNFNRTPNDRLAGNYQISMYRLRVSQYIDALAHIFNTGQGVVLERSPYSDFVFLEAMAAENYISKGVKSVYYDVKFNTIEELMRPHLVIYLDMPVDKVQEEIKSRGYEHEVQGKALTPSFLKELERQYKEKYLVDISTHAELLVYDWTGGGEVEVVVEDIEHLNFDQYTERTEPKLKDWRLPREVDWADKRMLYTNSKQIIMNQFNIPHLEVPELLVSGEDRLERSQVIMSHPAFEYEVGYGKGEWSLFKNKTPKYTECIN